MRINNSMKQVRIPAYINRTSTVTTSDSLNEKRLPHRRSESFDSATATTKFYRNVSHPNPIAITHPRIHCPFYGNLSFKNTRM